MARRTAAPSSTPQRPEFSRPARTADLPPEGVRFSEKAGAEELEALARRYGVRAVARLSTEGRIAPEQGGWRVSGVVRARVTQTCVVTLEPVDQVIEERFDRLYLPGAPEPDLLDLDPDAEDPPEPLGDSLDPAEAAAEATALAIDPYPRAEGAVFKGRVATPEGADPLTDETSRPFAALAALRARLAEDGGGGEGGGRP